MIVRRAEPADAQGLKDLGDAVGAEPEGWLVTTNGWRDVADERRYLRAIRRYPNAAVFVAEDEGAVVGRLSIARDQHPASAHVADLGLMVAASHRRRGIGTALLEAAVRWGRAAGVRPALLPARRVGGRGRPARRRAARPRPPAVPAVTLPRRRAARDRRHQARGPRRARPPRSARRRARPAPRRSVRARARARRV